MQDLISIVNSLVMISGSVLIAAVTVAPLLYAWSRSGEPESSVEIEKQDEAIALPVVPITVIEFPKARSAAKSKAIAQVVIKENSKTPTTVHGMRKALIARGVNGAARFSKAQCIAQG